MDDRQTLRPERQQRTGNSNYFGVSFLKGGLKEKAGQRWTRRDEIIGEGGGSSSANTYLPYLTLLKVVGK
jgi:hypothetical protein